MIRCSNCNAQVPDGTRFCDQCGRPLTNAPAPPAIRPAPPARPPAFDNSAGREPPPRQAGDPVRSAASSGNPGAPRAMPQPPLPPSARPVPDPPTGSPSGFKLPVLPPVARPTSDASAQPVGSDGWPAAPLMSTAPVIEVAIRPRATLAFTEAQTPYMLASDRDRFVIGREDPIDGIFPDVDLTLSGGIEAGVSRRHAVITFRDGNYWLEDLDSRNYTFVNGIRLAPNRPQSLRDGDELEFGTLRARFYLG